MIYEFLWAVTQLGSSHVLIPAIFGVAIVLWRVGEDRAAGAFLLGAAVCLASIVVSKLLLLTIGGVGPVSSPSGHTAISTFFYGCVALLCLWIGRGWPSKICAAAMAPLVLTIAVSRFIVAGHSRSETLVGLLFGLVALELFRRAGGIGARSLAAWAAPVAAGALGAAAMALVMNIGFIEEVDFIAIANWLRIRLAA